MHFKSETHADLSVERNRVRDSFQSTLFTPPGSRLDLSDQFRRHGGSNTQPLYVLSPAAGSAYEEQCFL